MFSGFIIFEYFIPFFLFIRITTRNLKYFKTFIFINSSYFFRKKKEEEDNLNEEPKNHNKIDLIAFRKIFSL